MTSVPILFPLSILFSAVTTTASLADQGSALGYGHHSWDGGMYGWFMAPLFMLFMVALVVGVVLVFRWIAGPGHHSPIKGNAALDILNERFARGEIDKDEFEDRRKVLGH